MRIQNEGTGKSSWWVINPDAKPGKPPRRRAGSMGSGEKKRGRINKKKQEVIRAALENCGSPINSSVEFLDTLGFGDFRSRTSSNASSCGRLSPTPDLHDNQVPHMSPIPWDGEVDVSTGFQGLDHFPELASSLADSMNISSQNSMDLSLSSNLNSDVYLSGTQEFASTPEASKGQIDPLQEQGQLSPQAAPPPYSVNVSTLSASSKFSKLQQILQNKIKHSGNAELLKAELVNMLNKMNSRGAQLYVNTQQQATTEGSQQSSPSTPKTMPSHLSPVMQIQATPQERLSPMNGQLPAQQQALLASPEHQATLSPKVQQQNALHLQQQHQQQQNKSILRSALTHGSPVFNQLSSNNSSLKFILGMTQTSASSATNSPNLNTNILNLGLSQEQQQLQQIQQHQQQQQRPLQLKLPSGGCNFLSQVTDRGNLTTGPVMNNVIMHSNSNTLTNSNNNLPADIQMETSTGNFMNLTDYELEQVIKQELTLEGNLDATFDNIMPCQ